MSGATTTGQTIVFNEIPSPWLVPGNYVEIRPNYTNMGIAAFPTMVLLVGQMLTGAPAAPGVPVPLFSAAQAAGMFGAGSVAARMAAAFLLANPTTPVDIVGLLDSTGAVKATGGIPFGSGTASFAGQVPLYICGTRIAVPVAQSDVNTVVATNTAALINSMPNLPVVASIVGGTPSAVVLTAKNGGVVGNAIDVRVDYLPSDSIAQGISIASVTPMSGGIGTPSISTLISSIASVWYTDIVLPWTDTTTLSALTAELTRRYGAMGRMDMHAHVGVAGSYGAVTAISDALNSQWLTMWPVRNPLDEPWVWAATAAGVSIAQLAIDPSRQLRGLALPGLHAPAPDDRWIESEHELLLSQGLSTWNVLADGTVVIERVVTTYQTTSLGVADRSWLDIMVPKTMTRIRYDWRTYNSLTYPRNKLADDGSIAAEYDDTIATPRRMSGAWAGRCTLYARAGWIENTDQTIPASLFVRDTTDRNRLNERLEVQIIGNLMIQAAALEFDV
jgi:phage tail sheath gpL-like